MVVELGGRSTCIAVIDISTEFSVCGGEIDVCEKGMPFFDEDSCSRSVVSDTPVVGDA